MAPRIATIVGLAVASVVGLSLSIAQEVEQEATATKLRWWKGNLHTHSLWSDGDDFPEMICDWYKSHDYNFLAISDHNTLNQGMRWISMEEVAKRSEMRALAKYLDRFGKSWVETREEADSVLVRLKPLEEYRYLLEQHDRFILIPSEEISAQAGKLPIHMNATNLREAIQPLNGDSVREVIEHNLRAVTDQAAQDGRTVMVHLNHPNFHYAVTAEELASVVSEQFFEVFNGHPGVNHLGDDQHPSVERIWDLANAMRLTQLNAAPLLGIATDDTHEYHGEQGARPGRGWVMVQSEFLTPEHLIRQMRNARFYASSGVVLKSVEFVDSQKTLKLSIDGEKSTKYRTDFIATLKPANSAELPLPQEIGIVVGSADGLAPEYTFQGHELYVRALVTSSDSVDAPTWEGQKKQAWTQPVGWSLP